MRSKILLSMAALAASLFMPARSRADDTQTADPVKSPPNLFSAPNSGNFVVGAIPGYFGGYPLGVDPPNYDVPVANDGWSVASDSLKCSDNPAGCPDVTTNTKLGQLPLGSYYLSFTVLNNSQTAVDASGTALGSVSTCTSYPTPNPFGLPAIQYGVLLTAQYQQASSLGRPEQGSEQLYTLCGTHATSQSGVETTYGGFFLLSSNTMTDANGNTLVLQGLKLSLVGTPGVTFSEISAKFLGSVGPKDPTKNPGRRPLNEYVK